MAYDHTQRIEVDKDLAIRPYTRDDVKDLFPRIVIEKAGLFMIDMHQAMSVARRWPRGWEWNWYGSRRRDCSVGDNGGMRKPI